MGERFEIGSNRLPSIVPVSVPYWQSIQLIAQICDGLRKVYPQYPPPNGFEHLVPLRPPPPITVLEGQEHKSA